MSNLLLKIFISIMEMNMLWFVKQVESFKFKIQLENVC